MRYNDRHKQQNNETYKMCNICQEWKPANTENFYAFKKSKDGLQSNCIVCSKELSKINYQKIKKIRKIGGIMVTENNSVLESRKMTREELKIRQAMSLKDKIDLSIERIEKWYDYFNGNIYVAFSGGKDSRVLLDLVWSIFPEVPAVYCDTGLEYPEIKEFVRSFDNVEIVKPTLTYRQVIEKYGWPVVSKEQSRYINQYINTKSEKLRSIRLNGNKWGMGKISKKWFFLTEAPFKISDMCCYVLKKDPAKRYERLTGRKGMIGSTTEESAMRQETYLRFGCNAYNTKRPLSMPLAFWTKQDILQYIKEKNLSLASVYGEIKERENGHGKELYTTGVDRTGCVWCMFGLQKEKAPNKIQKLKETHPKIYDYCINNLGMGDVLDFIGIDYE